MRFKRVAQSQVIWLLIGSALTIFVLKGQLFLAKLPSDFGGWATIISVVVVVGLYYHEQKVKKITAARLVLKEIEAVFPPVNDFLEKRKYDLKTLSITTGHWRNQSYLFMAEMDKEYISQIEKIYSCGKYIQKHIEAVDEYKRLEYAKIYQEALTNSENTQKTAEIVINSPEVTARVTNINKVADSLMSSFVQEAAKEVRGAKGWAGYVKLQEIAKM